MKPASKRKGTKLETAAFKAGVVAGKDVSAQAIRIVLTRGMWRAGAIGFAIGAGFVGLLWGMVGL